MAVKDEIGRGRGGIGKNPARSRDHNRRVVLDLLRQNGPQGRKELAEATQLSSPAVANILDELLAEGLILDLGRRRAGRGQPPLHFALNPEGAHTFGFEIGVNGIVTVVLDLLGNPVTQRRSEPESLAPEDCLRLLQSEIAALRADAAGQLLGIGVVLPGPFSTDAQRAADPTTLQGWEDVTAQSLSEALGHPVWMENDANAAALSEALFGAAAQLHHAAVIYFGEGVGLGVLNEGRLLRGARGNAGEIGHIVTVPNGRPCPCGQRGCFERYVSRHALAEALGMTLRPGAIGRLWQEQDPRLLGWIAEAGRHLAPMAAMIENMLDPESIIIAGQLPAPVIEALIAAVPLVPSVAAHPARALPRLCLGQSGAFTAALGAAALPLYEALTPQSWVAQPDSARGGEA